ncbi:MAG: glycosyltransferase [Patescibacteria group bacterium]
MNIIYVENVRIPSGRAHAYQIAQTCAWFGAIGADVTLVNPARAEGKDVFAAYGLPRDGFRHVTLPSLDPLAWSWFPSKRLAYGFQRWAFVRALAAWSRDRHPDIWYTRDPAMVDVLTRPDRRIALELHDAPDSNPKRWERIKERVTWFIVISDGLRGKLVSLGIPAERIRVAHDGYDPADFGTLIPREEARRSLDVPPDAFVAFYLGTFYPWKGVDLVVRAWAKTDPRMHLVLIGGPEADARRLKGLVAASSSTRVHLIPPKEHRDAVRLLPAADVALLTTSPDHEIGRSYTSPLKLFEYLAAGLPILASDVPSSHEVLDESVARFYPSTETGFVDALAAMAGDPTWRASASIEAKQVVRPYSWEARTRSIYDFIRLPGV